MHLKTTCCKRPLSLLSLSGLLIQVILYFQVDLSYQIDLDLDFILVCIDLDLKLQWLLKSVLNSLSARESWDGIFAPVSLVDDFAQQ